MKDKLLLLFLIISTTAIGQQKKYLLNWEASQTMSIGLNSFKIPSFDKHYLVYDFENGLQFADQWEVANEIDETSIALSNVKFASISKTELLDLDESKIPFELEYSFKNSKARDKMYASFQLSPIVKDLSGNYKKVISFDISYNTALANKNLINKSNSLSGVINSVLNSGNWYKFYIDKSGVYKLSKNFLKSLGINVNTDPRTIKIYGNGGRMIPYSNAITQHIDAQENAIKFVGEEDGVFNDEDYILFYGQGPEGYEDLRDNITISDPDPPYKKSHLNIYTDRTYYYINISPNTNTNASIGKRIQPLEEPIETENEVIDTFKDYKFYEVDQYNIASMGRRWFGDKFNIVNNKTYTFNFPDLIKTNPISIRVYLAATSSSSTSFKISFNGSLVSTKSIPPSDLGSENYYHGLLYSTNESATVNLDFNNQGNPSATGYLDYISLEADRALYFRGQQLHFNNFNALASSGVGQIKISNASNVSEIWDLTDIYNIKTKLNSQAESDFKFKTGLDQDKEYIALTPLDYYQPKSDQTTTTVANQNIKGTVFLDNEDKFKDVDYIIVAPNNMLSQANRLAQINRNQYNLNVKVYSLNEIYNEFSSGNPDIGAIRNLVKYVYDNASAPEKKIKYLCLFGDASFDYKDKLSLNSNIVPSWYSYDSFSLTSSFISDDFYGMMDYDEGTMSNNEMLDIAVGRILADTPQRAKELVDKIEAYYDKKSFGNWRNKVVVISDDVDKSDEAILQITTDNIGNTISQEKPFLNVVKIHSDAFKQESSAGGNSYPEVNTEITNAFEQGALVINYFGHGGEEGLSSERILSKVMINDFNNLYKLNCFVTVTCEFTKFDNPNKLTAGEFVYWNKQGGAISLISTTRQIFVPMATLFNNTLGQYLFSFNKNDTFADDEYPSIAESLRLTKNTSSISSQQQRLLVFFIGDPAMKLAIPKPNIRLTKINDIPISQPIDTLKALSYIKLSGEITDSSGTLLDKYNGKLSITIYDKNINRTTLGNDGIKANAIDKDPIKLNFTTLGEIIFKGQASAKNGLFELGFVVPKDIGIPVGFGKISFYAEAEGILQDQSGASINTIKIGGINENAAEDKVGPVTKLYLNDENFVSGGITNESPILLAKIEDENGINTASGIGHDMTAILDGDETNPINLNDYYQTEVDNYKKGNLSFPLKNLKPGLHTLNLKVWDVYNNSSSTEIQFTVYDKDEVLAINNVLNYPNPFVNYTEFWFNHNSFSPLDVSIQIFTVSGKLVRTLNGQALGGVLNKGTLSRDITWDGRDDFGDKIGKGVYVYKLTVYSSVLNKKVEKIEKLVIL